MALSSSAWRHAILRGVTLRQGLRHLYTDRARAFPRSKKLSKRLAFSSAAFTVASLSAVGLGMTREQIIPPQAKEVREGDSTSVPSIAMHSTLHLLRSYLVWTLLGIPFLVDASPVILKTFLHSPIPGIQAVTEFFVRSTFFAQFIPGETAIECIPAMEELRRRNVGSALNYSAEADMLEEPSALDLTSVRFHEIERGLDLQGEFERQMSLEGWATGSSSFAVKVTGLVDPLVLIRATNTLHRIRAVSGGRSCEQVLFPGTPSDIDSTVLAPQSSSLIKDDYSSLSVPDMGVTELDPGLQEGDLGELKLLWNRLDSLADRARRNGVRLIFDAEETFYQPAIDGYTRLLSIKYNRPSREHSSTWKGPVIFGTFQSYLCRQPSFLTAAIKHAKDNGYVLGIKLVRGGYIAKERFLWNSSGKQGNEPIWPEKAKTDTCYNQSLKIILHTLKSQLEGANPQMSLSVIFGTHNISSVGLIIDTLVSEGLAIQTGSRRLRIRDDVLGKVGIAQLYGMRDDISDKIQNTFEVNRAPVSLIFIAYGKLGETLPFLSRRAIENKSLMSGDGGAAVERRRVGAELRRRLSFGLL